MNMNYPEWLVVDERLWCVVWLPELEISSKVRMLLLNSVIPESIINIHKIQSFLYLIFALIPKWLIEEQIINPYYKIYNPGIKHAYKSRNTSTVGYMIMNNDTLMLSYIKSINPQYCSISINPTI